MKENVYTAYYAVSENVEIVTDREIKIPRMEEDTVAEQDVTVVPDTNVTVMIPGNRHNEETGQNGQT